MVSSLLRDFVDEDFIADLDLSTLERCSGDYVTDDLRERHDDVIWRVRWKDSWAYLFVLIEAQSQPDPWMPVRILAYTALLWQDLIRTGAVTRESGLPPIFPIVIYNGTSAWNVPQDITALLAAEAGRLLAYQPRQHYFLLDESRVPAADIAERPGVVAQLLRLERAGGPDEVRQVVSELIEQLRAPEYQQLRRAFAVWLGRVVLRRKSIAGTQAMPEIEDLQEVDAMLEENAARWETQYKNQCIAIGRAEGMAEGRIEGMAEGRAAVALSMLEGGMPMEQIVRFTGLSTAEIQALRKVQ